MKVSFTDSAPQVGTVMFLSFPQKFLVDDSVAFGAFLVLFTDRAVFLDCWSVYFVVAVARDLFEVPIAISAVRPRLHTIGDEAVSVTTHCARVSTTVIFFVAVSYLARMAPITPVQVTAHGRDDVEMMIVVKHVDAFGLVRSFPNNLIQIFFGHHAQLIVRDHLLKDFHLVKTADVSRYSCYFMEFLGPLFLVSLTVPDTPPNPVLTLEFLFGLRWHHHVVVQSFRDRVYVNIREFYRHNVTKKWLPGEERNQPDFGTLERFDGSFLKNRRGCSRASPRHTRENLTIILIILLIMNEPK